MPTLVHVTHEAIQKIGGIGAVLQGLLTCRHFLDHAERNVLVGPYWHTGGAGDDRLGVGGRVLYSSLDGIDRTTFGDALGDALGAIRERYHVEIVYGRRRFADARSGVASEPEVLLIDVSRFDAARIGDFKFRVWERFGIDSARYEREWDFEQWMRLAEPTIEALRAIGAVADQVSPTVILSHEYMGMPTVLAAMMAPDAGAFRSIFYAHEVATMRRIVEEHPGHDTRFYNALDLALAGNRHVDEVFGTQDDFYKHALVKQVVRCDAIFGVGDRVLDEFRFMGPAFATEAATARSSLAYNGVPHFEIDLAEKLGSRERLRDYCAALLGDRPDHVFTHVTRLVPSKGLWRDLRVMEAIERSLRDRGESAVLIVLSTEAPARRGEDVRRMERDYRWPIAHREGGTDLSGGEARFYAGVQAFNARSRNAKVVYLNQFGFTRETCGMAMPLDMEFLDVRKGSDVEFGQSIYEPFGIAQVEPIGFGGLCVYTSLCGCAGLVRRAAVDAGLARENEGFANVIEADYVRGRTSVASLDAALAIGATEREAVERVEAERVAAEILGRLPTTIAGHAEALARGQRVAGGMSWEAVARRHLVPGLARVVSRQPDAR